MPDEKNSTKEKAIITPLLPVIWLEDGRKERVPQASVIIVCGRPGLRRVGVEHEQVKIWPKGHFSASQLAQINRDPQFTVVEVG